MLRLVFAAPHRLEAVPLVTTAIDCTILWFHPSTKQSRLMHAAAKQKGESGVGRCGSGLDKMRRNTQLGIATRSEINETDRHPAETD